MSWVKPTFESEDGGIPGPSLERLAASNMSGRDIQKPKLVKDKAWVDSYGPTHRDHLAVHYKKIRELESWITTALLESEWNGPVGVLVGPSGSGKTATLLMVAKSMGFLVREWLNPSNFRTDGPSTSSQEFVGYTNQAEQFSDFLFRASRYEDIFTPTFKRSVLLVEDIPNVYLQDSNLLEKTIRQYMVLGRRPLVFVLVSGTNKNLEKMFRKIKVDDEKIKIISFNPISKTLMCKALERILKAARSDQSIGDLELSIIDDAVDLANGDIRFAVNHLQYMLLGARAPVPCCVPPEKVLSKTVEKGGTKNEIEYQKPMKDKAAEIFRSVGAVLYNKQTTFTDEKTGVILQKPIHDPEEVSSKMSSVPDLFHGLLCENYPSVMTSINSIASASDILSQTDVMLNKHTDGAEIDVNKTLATNVSVHGLINLSSSDVAKKFLPFKGARIKEVTISARTRWRKCRDLFPTSCLPPQTLMTEVCPFLVQMDMGALSSDKKKFIHEVSQLMSMSQTTFEFEDEEEEPAPCEFIREMFIVEVPTEENMNNTPEEEVIEIEESLSSEENV